MTDQQIWDALQGQGWLENDVRQAIRIAGNQLPPITAADIRLPGIGSQSGKRQSWKYVVGVIAVLVIAGIVAGGIFLLRAKKSYNSMQSLGLTTPQIGLSQSQDMIDNAVQDYYRLHDVFPDSLTEVEEYYQGYYDRENKLYGQRSWSLAPLSAFEYNVVGEDKKDYRLCIPQDVAFKQTEPGKECHSREFLSGIWKNDTPQHRDAFRSTMSVHIMSNLNTRYYQAHGQYPDTLLDSLYVVNPSTCLEAGCINVGYLEFEDPSTLLQYEYSPSDNRQSYQLCVTYEATIYGIGYQCDKSAAGKRVYGVPSS